MATNSVDDSTCQEISFEKLWEHFDYPEQMKHLILKLLSYSSIAGLLQKVYNKMESFNGDVESIQVTTFTGSKYAECQKYLADQYIQLPVSEDWAKNFVPDTYGLSKHTFGPAISRHYTFLGQSEDQSGVWTHHQIGLIEYLDKQERINCCVIKFKTLPMPESCLRLIEQAQKDLANLSLKVIE